MTENIKQEKLKQGILDNFYAPNVIKGELLLRMLPFGVCSKQGLAILGQESQVLYKFIEQGYVIKEKRTIKKKGKFKNETFCYLTPNGLRRICEDEFAKPEWIRHLNYKAKSFQMCPNLSTASIQTLTAIQDAIIFFSYAGVPNFLTALLAMEPTAVLILQRLSFDLASIQHNTVLERTADAISFLFQENKSENSFAQECCNEFNNFNMFSNGDTSKLFLSDSSYLQTAEKCFETILSKKQPREYFMTHRETNAAIKQRNFSYPDDSLRDSSIGFYAGKKQSIQIFVATRNGLSHCSRLKKQSQRFTMLCANYAARDSTRSASEIGQTAIVLCRKDSEFVRTILDPFKLRKSINDKTFRNLFNRTFLLPMNSYGMQMVRNFGSLSVEEYEDRLREDRKTLAENVFDELRYDNHFLYDTVNDCRAFIGYEFEATELYSAMEEAETTDKPVALIIRTWQQNYYDFLQRSWHTYPLFGKKTSNYGFIYYLLEADELNDPYKTPMPGDGRLT